VNIAGSQPYALVVNCDENGEIGAAAILTRSFLWPLYRIIGLTRP
jgi:hypothetical protein